jgi:ribonucleoside-diphosphate reductase alpha chain
LSFRSAAEESASPSSGRSTGGHTTPATHEFHGEAFHHSDRTPPQQGIAPDLAASNGLSSGPSTLGPDPLSLEDRSVFHTASAMKAMYEMGDSPSCSTCGAIMTRNGSCYRCMECGSTSGCS